MTREVVAASGGDVADVGFVMKALSQPIAHDIRDEHQMPLFKSSIRSIEELQVGEEVSLTVETKSSDSPRCL